MLVLKVLLALKAHDVRLPLLILDISALNLVKESLRNGLGAYFALHCHPAFRLFFINFCCQMRK